MSRFFAAAIALSATLLVAVPGAQASRAAGAVLDLPDHRAVPDIPSHVRTHASAGGERLAYDGGPVLHSNRTHAIFWEPQGSGLTFDPGYESLIEAFLRDVAADSHRSTNVYGLSGQYYDGTGPAAYDSTYGDSVVTTDRLPPNGCVEPPLTGPGWLLCVNDEQLETELARTIAANHLPTTGRDIYFLLTPRGLGDCLDTSSTNCALGTAAQGGYCGYHSDTPDSQHILYAVIPYNAVPGHCQSDNPRPNHSTADPSISTISHEHNEVVTDPLAEKAAWIANSGAENGDLCDVNFGPPLGGSGSAVWNEVIHGGHFYLQEEWSNEDQSCQPRDEADAIFFAGPRRIARRTLQFTARASDPDGAIVSYTWFFGDGRRGSGRRVSHRYARRGTYRVVLRTTDRAANFALFARSVVVSAR